MSFPETCLNCTPSLFDKDKVGSSPASKKLDEIRGNKFSELLSGISSMALKFYKSKEFDIARIVSHIYSYIIVDDSINISKKLVALQDTIIFLENLPRYIPLPEVDVDESGEITIEWFKDRWNIFSLIIDGSGKYYYAGLFGDESDRDRGVKPINKPISSQVIDNIRRITE